MPTAKVAVTVDRELLKEVDRWVKRGAYPNRSQAVQAALRNQADRWRRNRLVQELKKLDPREERALADERLRGDVWPES